MRYMDVLAYYLDKSGITASELARRINSPRQTVHALLHGQTLEPTLGRAKAIADALGVSLEEMAAMMFEDEK